MTCSVDHDVVKIALAEHLDPPLPVMKCHQPRSRSERKFVEKTWDPN